MKEKKKHPNEIFEYDFINSSAALPHFYCSYSLSGIASCSPPPTSTLGELAHRFFFFFSPKEIKELSLCRRFFSPSRWVEKKRKKRLHCLCLTASLIPTKEEEEEKGGEKKEIPSTVGTTDLQQVNDPLVKIAALEGSARGAGEGRKQTAA